MRVKWSNELESSRVQQSDGLRDEVVPEPGTILLSIKWLQWQINQKIVMQNTYGWYANLHYQNFKKGQIMVCACYLKLTANGGWSIWGWSITGDVIDFSRFWGSSVKLLLKRTLFRKSGWCNKKKRPFPVDLVDTAEEKRMKGWSRQPQNGRCKDDENIKRGEKGKEEGTGENLRAGCRLSH